MLFLVQKSEWVFTVLSVIIFYGLLYAFMPEGMRFLFLLGFFVLYSVLLWVILTVYMRRAEKWIDLGLRYAKNAKDDGMANHAAKAVKYFLKAAIFDHARKGQSLINLGLCYAEGFGVEKALVKAAQCYQMATTTTKEEDDLYNSTAIASLALGFCYAEGLGVMKDTVKAEDLFKRAEKCCSGWVSSVWVDLCYDELLKDFLWNPIEVEMWLRKAAEFGNAKSQYVLGIRYSVRYRNQTVAARWYRKAADQGYAEAQSSLGDCYRSGAGVEKDEAAAVRWYRKAADQGYAEAQSSLGDCYRSGAGIEKDEAEAVRWDRKAADQDHAKAQSRLGACYISGAGVEKDEVKAVWWFRKAAKWDTVASQYLQAVENGAAEALSNLGDHYRFGVDVEKDEVEAVRWYRKAAELGYAKAQCSLGDCYRSGAGVEKDEAEAVRWYRKAADQGYAEAQCSLGDCYRIGAGVEKDEAEAVRWSNKAMEQNHAAQFHHKAVEQGDSDVQNVPIKTHGDDDKVGKRMNKSTRKIIIGVLVLALLILTNPGKEAHWAESEAFFETQAAKEGENAGWLKKIGFLVMKNPMKASIYDALYIKSYGVCSVGYIAGHVATFGILGVVFFVGSD